MELFDDLHDGGDSLEPNHLLEDDLPSEEDDDDDADDDDDDDVDGLDTSDAAAVRFFVLFYSSLKNNQSF